MHGDKATKWNGWKCKYINFTDYRDKTHITFSNIETYRENLIKFSEVTEEKFYPGQRVICRNDVSGYYGYRTKNEKGTIVRKSTSNDWVVNFDNYVNGWSDTKLGIKDGHGLYVLEKYLEPLKELKEAKQEIHITIKDNKTIAVLKENGKVTKRAEAICCPTDTFDAHIGVDIVLDRLFGKVEKNTIEVGDTVEVIDTGELYSTYKSWFKYAKLERFEENYIYQGQIEPNRKYEVVGTGKHEVGKDTIYLIQNPITRQVFIMSKKGIRKV